MSREPYRYNTVYEVWHWHQLVVMGEHLKLLSLFAAWLFWTFHIKSYNMKALVILIHSWSPFLPLICLYGKHDHPYAQLVMAWLLSDKRKFEHNFVRLVFIYILLSTCQWVHMALAINRPDILLISDSNEKLLQNYSCLI